MGQYSKTDARLSSANNLELHLAATAVVDAAICCWRSNGHNLAGLRELDRLLLIDSVCENPELTAKLFGDFSWD